MSENKLAADGWNSVWVEYNAYTEGFFEDMEADPASIQKFLDAEVDEYRLVALSDESDYAYVLEKEEPIDGSG